MSRPRPRPAARPRPGSLASFPPGTCGRGEAAEDGVEDVRHPCQTGPVVTGEDGDATHEGQHGRQPDSCTDALGARGCRPEQVTDPSGEQLEVVLADAWSLRGRVALRTGRDCDKPVRAVGVQAAAHRHSAQSGVACGVVGDNPEELLERATTGLDRAGEDVALGDPVAVGDGERGELVPQEEEAAERREEARVQPARPASPRRSAPRSGAG